jgi:hypothetical protein
MVKKKRLSYSLGDLDCIEIPSDWRKCEGIQARRRETNMGLAKRDYSKKCRHTHKLIVVEGFWIWWCDTHNQPASWCDNKILHLKIKELEDKIRRAQEILK